MGLDDADSCRRSARHHRRAWASPRRPQAGFHRSSDDDGARLVRVQKRAYIIADNKLSENAGWDAALLKIEFEGLKELNFDTALIGFKDEPATFDDDKKASNAGDGDDALFLSIDGRKVLISEAERDFIPGAARSLRRTIRSPLRFRRMAV